MVSLYNREFTRREISQRAGSLAQFAGVRLMTLGDGLERGVRMLEFRTGTGLRFTSLVDRAMDLADCEYRGQAIGWHSPAGFRHPGLHEYEGEGGLAWARSFSGLQITCGLDHILFNNEVPATEFAYPLKPIISHSLHGRIGTVPARLTGYGEHWEEDRCILWAEGIVQQATVFGEDLHLHRRIEADVGGNEIRLADRVINHGFYRTPHMFCYHLNLGYPLLDEGSRFLAPVVDVVWASHDGPEYRSQGIGYRTMPAPGQDLHEQVWQYELGCDGNGHVPVALVNDRLGLGFEITTRKAQFPCLYHWQNFQAGQYAMGIEPSSNHVLGNLAARERGEMTWLEHGDERSYDTVFRVLGDAEQIVAAEKRIRGIAQQPADEFPAPSGNFRPIGGRR